MAKKKGVTVYETYYRMGREFDEAAEETRRNAKVKKQEALKVVRANKTAVSTADGSLAIRRAAGIAKGVATKASKAESIRAVFASDLIAYHAKAYTKKLNRKVTHNARLAVLASIEEQLRRRRFIMDIQLTGMKLHKVDDNNPRAQTPYSKMHSASSFIDGIAHRDLVTNGTESGTFKHARDNLIDQLMRYDIVYFRPFEQTFTKHELLSGPDALAHIRMKESRDLVFDGADMSYDKGEGCCFPDWYIHAFSNEPKLKQYCSREKLAEIAIAQAYIDDPTQEVHDKYGNKEFIPVKDDPLKYGFHSRHIERIATMTGQSMIAMVDGKNIVAHIPKVRNHVGSICYEIHGNHFYPMRDKELQSVSQSVHLKVSSEMINMRIATKSDAQLEKDKKAKIARVGKNASATSGRAKDKVVKERERTWDEVEIVELDGEDGTQEYLFSKMVEFNAVPHKNSIYMKDNCIHTFILGGTKFLVNQDAENARQVCENIGREWDGVTIHQLIFDELEQLELVPPRSVMNPEVFATFAAEGIKSRMHYGCRNGYTEESIRALYPSRLTASDITKCYPGALYSTEFPFIFPTFNDHWEPFDESIDDIATPGFYKVTTYNQFPLSGDNIYPMNDLVPARANGVEFIPYQKLICSGRLEPEFMRKIIDRFLIMSRNEMNLFKTLGKVFSGWLGKTHFTKIDVNIECNPVIIAHKLLGAASGATPITQAIGTHNEKTYFAFGVESPVTEKKEHTLPFYLQMLGNANANFYRMVKAMEGTALYFKLDYALVLDGVMAPVLGGLGSYHEVDMCCIDQHTGEVVINLPENIPLNKRDICPVEVTFQEIRDFTNAPISDSAHWEMALELLKHNNGLLIQGEGGTGKTTMASRVAYALEVSGYNVVRLSPANKAANNIGGVTVHSYLHMNCEMAMVDKRLREIVREAQRKPTLIWFNEISTASRRHWQNMCILKKLCPSIIFLLEGDYRQCSPVESVAADEYESYFEHACVKFLANHVRCTLLKNYRYTAELQAMFKDVKSIDFAKHFIANRPDKVNICFTHACRKEVNAHWMNREAPQDALVLLAWPLEPKSQDIKVYRGLPIIACKSAETKGGVRAFTNSEYFMVTYVGKKSHQLITCEGLRKIKKRCCDDADEYENIVLRITHDELREFFWPRYCTTVHKVQGDTFVKKYAIWQNDRMPERVLYTALTRTKTKEQISINSWNRPSVPRIEDKTLLKMMQRKLDTYERSDRKDNKFGRGERVDVKSWVDLHIQAQGECWNCGEQVKLCWTVPGDPLQISLDAVDDTVDGGGHIKSNCRLSCWGCNAAHKNKSYVE